MAPNWKNKTRVSEEIEKGNKQSEKQLRECWNLILEDWKTTRTITGIYWNYWKLIYWNIILEYNTEILEDNGNTWNRFRRWKETKQKIGFKFWKFNQNCINFGNCSGKLMYGKGLCKNPKQGANGMKPTTTTKYRKIFSEDY